MWSRKVRAVVSTRFGCHERTGWFPEGSPEAVEAMQTLVGEQTEMVCIEWEDQDDEVGSSGYWK